MRWAESVLEALTSKPDRDNARVGRYCSVFLAHLFMGCAFFA